ncbi:MAG TPA: protein-glutamate O-methyltransferase CheR [Anaeromyxobacteraceae bacterium]|nr:protein-glutamate O-methyltransferase CheR [Anaeromyxobacteraceae bacterium]
MSLAPEDFDFFRGYLRERSAIALDVGKEYLVETRLLPVARREGLSTVGALIRKLREQPHGPLQLSVVEALTTNETSFFRDWKPFEALRSALLPEASVRRSTERRLDLWSAACSTGQEAYSVAMLIREHLPQLAAWDVQIHCTDLSQEMVERTRAGRFTLLEVNRGLPAALLVKYFRQEGDEWVIADEFRRRLRVAQLNLAGPWPVLPQMDVVLLRNVLIYFDIPTRRAILEKVRRQMRRGGILFLGSAETTVGIHDGFRREESAGATFFRAAP